MPTYGYRCQNCSAEFEVWQRMTDASEASCPTCGGTGRRLIFPVGIVFKGSGFYATDNRARSGGGQAAKDGAAAGASKNEKATIDTKTETKTASTAESASSPAPSSDGKASGSSG